MLARTPVTESTGLAVPVNDNNRVLCLKLHSAGFLNGENLPRSLTFDSSGRVLTDSIENATADATARATEIDVQDAIVFPALINSHDHLEFNLYPPLGKSSYADVDEWSRDVHRRYSDIISAIESIPLELRLYWGVLKNLSWGVTAVMNHSEPQSHSYCDLSTRVIEPQRFLHRADKRWAWFRARKLTGDGPLVFHVAEGTSNAVGRRSARFIRRMRGRGPLVGVHGIKLTREDAEHLDALVWCPASNLFLFDRTADIASLKSATKILFGTDATISAQGTIWDHLRIARTLGHLTDNELLDSVTINAERVWGLGRTGDMVIARRRHPQVLESFYQVTPADICAVVTQNHLAMMSEAFFEDVAIDAWRNSYRAITIGDVRQRIYNPSPIVLEQLASIANSPVALRSFK